MFNNNSLLSLTLCILFLFFTACTASVRQDGPSLVKLSSRQVHSYDWTDVLDVDGLKHAVEQSKSYYEKLPPSRLFQYGNLAYSPEEMINLLDLFMETIENYTGDERVRLLRKDFHFFESINSDGEAFFTGYYEPVLEGSSVWTDEFPEPLYGISEDLIEVDLGKFPGNWGGERIVGRLEGNRLVPYDSREDIVYGLSLKERAMPLAYVRGIELFFLQIQGSGLIRFSDGSFKRVNYAQKNGHPYRSIGRLLSDRIAPEEISLQTIKQYLYNNPDEVRGVLSYNKSYTFFREVEEGPLGNIEVPLTPERSIAMDRRIVPKGGLAFIETELPVFDNDSLRGWRPVRRFVLVQDTGGAIRDHGRVDLFFGHDSNAELSAGHMKQRGRVFLLVARKELLNKM